MKKLNDKTTSQFHHVEKRIELPNIKDIDDGLNFSKITIEDATKDTSISNLGYIEIIKNGKTTYKKKNQYMTYDDETREIVVRFATINDLIRVNGTHSVMITLEDEKHKNLKKLDFVF